MNNKNNNKGFSLLELLVCLAISGFIILAAFSFVLVGMDNYKRTSKTTSLQQEVSFTDNTFGEAIRDSSKADVYIIKYKTNDGTHDNGDIELHTGKKVLFYDNSNNSIYIYEEISFNPASPINSDNLVTKYAKSLSIDFVYADANVDNPTTGNTYLEDHTTSESDKDTITAFSRLVKVKADFEYKGKTSVSDVTYQIRNK